MRSRRAITLVEAAIALSLFSITLAGAWQVLSLARRGEKKVTDLVRSVANAELALEFLSADLRSMMPLGPTTMRTGLVVAPDGRRVAFHRLERRRRTLEATPVVYEARPTGAGHGNFRLFSDGRPLKEVVLRDFLVRRVDQAQNARLEVTVLGIPLDRDPGDLDPETIHELKLTIPLPPPGPASIPDLPPDARAMVEAAITVSAPLEAP